MGSTLITTVTFGSPKSDVVVGDMIFKPILDEACNRQFSLINVAFGF